MLFPLNRAIIAAALALAIAPAASHVAFAASAASGVSVTISPALAVTNTQQLNFTSIVPSATSDTVEVSPQGVLTCGANLTCSGIARTSEFAVTGGANLVYAITLPAAPVALISGGDSMVVDNFLDSESGSGTLDNTGANTFAVGATLNVGANQPTGNYVGTFTVTVEYN